MRANVSVVGVTSGYVLRLTEPQSRLISSAILFVRDRPEGDLGTVVRLGADRVRITDVWEKISMPESIFLPEEVHVIFAALSGAVCMIASEEEFYIRIGFFREQALALANGLARAVSVAGPASES